jgi:hypothetical protein
MYRVASLLQEKILQMVALLFTYIFTLFQVHQEIKDLDTVWKVLIILTFTYVINEILCLEKTRLYALKKSKLKQKIDFIEETIFGSVRKRRLLGCSLKLISVISLFLLAHLISRTCEEFWTLIISGGLFFCFLLFFSYDLKDGFKKSHNLPE